MTLWDKFLVGILSSGGIIAIVYLVWLARDAVFYYQHPDIVRALVDRQHKRPSPPSGVQ